MWKQWIVRSDGVSEALIRGRYVRRSDKQKTAEWFHAEAELASPRMADADYNIAPTTSQPIVRQSRETGEREMILARWGLVPFFTKDISDAKGYFENQCKSGADSDSKDVARAIHEWPKDGKPLKQPYIFELANATLFAFAGVWDAWKDGQGHCL